MHQLQVSTWVAIAGQEHAQVIMAVEVTVQDTVNIHVNHIMNGTVIHQLANDASQGLDLDRLVKVTIVMVKRNHSEAVDTTHPNTHHPDTNNLNSILTYSDPYG